MTGRERWLAAFQREQTDRTMFWPKIYRAGYMKAQGGKFADMSALDMYRYWGCDFMDYFVGNTAGPVFHSGVSLDIKQEGLERQFIVNTRKGSISLKMQFDIPSQSFHPVDYPIKTVEDIALAIEFFEHVDFVRDPSGSEKQKHSLAQIGDDGVLVEMIGESPLMAFVEYFTGLENAHYMLADYPDEVEALFDAMQRMYKRQIDVIADNSLADVFVFTENTSTTMISRNQFIKYCKKHLNAYAQWLDGCKTPLMIHMCGKLNSIADGIAQLQAPIFEAISSAPIGDVTLPQVQKVWPDKCIIGGGNAVLLLEDTDVILANIEETIGNLNSLNGIVLSSGGIIPPGCGPEKIKKITEYVHSVQR